MMRSSAITVVLGCTLFFSGIVRAQEKDAKKAPETMPPVQSVEKLAEDARASVVVIIFTGRDGKQQGLGTGFVVSADGLIATNNHVIGEARPIAVQLHDGTRHEATAVHASDRTLDLALIKIDAKNLKPLPLGDASGLKLGQPIVALGHPRGLKYSVVAGVLSGQRDIDGLSMLQLAIPIEQGNSGGPILDMQGQVQGIVTMKSLVTANLGFAVPISALKPLLAKPNPIPMEHWLTIGALNKSEWKTLHGGRWRQRAGRIISDGFGAGFGGRTLCLSLGDSPKDAYEIAVTVRLEDESGAAGIIFGGDGGDKHLGFYPSGGRLRFTSFNGPDVFSWKVIKEFPSEHYRPKEWNTIKVRVDKDDVRCFVNDEEVFQTTIAQFPGEVIGLAKFREPSAEFKHFQVAAKIAPVTPAPAVVKRLVKAIDALADSLKSDNLKPGAAASFVPDARASMDLLRQKARALELKAAHFRKLAVEIYHQRVLADLAAAVNGKDIDLTLAALLIAKLDNEELDVEEYRREVDRLARDVTERFPKKAADKERLEALNHFLFKERGYHGSRFEYYSRSNSYLNEVIDDREGLPITLAVLYMEVARRLGLNVVGVALPAHFMVRHEPAKGSDQLIDVFDGGKFLSEKEASAKIADLTGKPLDKKHLAAVEKKTIVMRMLHNLLNVAEQEQDRDGMLRYLDGIVAVAPDSAEERWVRAVFRFQAGRKEAALEDVDWLLEHNPPGVDLARVRELRRLLTRPEP